MKEPYAPCKECADRVAEDPETGAVDCHKSCRRYEEFKAEVVEYKKERKQRKKREYEADRPWLDKYKKHRKER